LSADRTLLLSSKKRAEPPFFRAARLDLPAKAEVHIWRVAVSIQSRLTSRWALRQLLACYLDLAPEQVVICRDDRGKPRLANNGKRLEFNLSHSADLALIAVACGARVGVDLEKVKPRHHLHGIAGRALEPAAAAEVQAAPAEERVATFHRMWTQHEARLKCLGIGLAGPAASGEIALTEIEVPAGYVATVALAAPEIKVVRHRNLRLAR
jgi:phosphopantetheinyl transferase